MNFKCIVFLVISFLAGNSFVIAGEYVVIINSTNSYAESTDKAKQDIRLFYLKNLSTWPNNEKVKPYGMLSTSEGQEAFNKMILNMSGSQLTQHWLSKKQTTGETPPKALKSDRIIIKLVTKKTGAFGVISKSKSASLPSSVKVLFEFSG